MQPRIIALSTLALLACGVAVDVVDAAELREVMVGGGGTVFNTNQIEQTAFSELAQPFGKPTQGISLVQVWALHG